MSYSVVIAGSTERTRVCASTIFADERFKIIGILTPGPKPIGREHIAEPNPMHIFGIAHEKPLVVIDHKIDEEIRGAMGRVFQKPDILLVVDFGYIIPQWMLDWPTIAPINIHPSALPKYRGSSPGQFSILCGEKDSAVTIMVMDAKMDHGSVIAQYPFTIEKHWKTADYYEHAFDLVREKLTDTLVDFIKHKIAPAPQPEASLTPTARHLKRQDGFVPFDTLEALLNAKIPKTGVPFLQNYQLPTTNYQLFNLWRAFHPWPGLWTEMEIKGEKKRVKLLEFHFEEDMLFLSQAQIEGKLPQPWPLSSA